MNFKLTYPQRTRTVDLNSGNISIKRQEILNYFEQTFDLYESLFSLLNDESAYYHSADPLRHPLIFYLGHTAVFYINKLKLANVIKERINPKFESMFAVGVDEMSWDDVQPTHYDWPSTEELFTYRQKVRHAVVDAINAMEITLPIRWKDPAWVVLMGIEHENIHLETSSVLIRQLPLNLVKANSAWLPCRTSNAAPKNRLLKVSGRKISLGKNLQDNYYGWDNEYGHDEIEVQDFKASQYLVSNQEFLEFIESGGYENCAYWTEEGLKWRNYLQVQHPRFWRKNEKGQYYLRLLAEEIPMPWDWPVEVNYLEAKAFCNWLKEKTKKPIRLPTEGEWTVLSDSLPEHYPTWEKAIGNTDLSYYASSCPVNQFQHGEFFDIVGNVWQWTETFFHSLPGFRVHPVYDDFSTPTFNGQHNLIKGGSWISTGDEITPYARYAFRRHFYQHAGFRYVESEVEPRQKEILYESDRLLSEYLEFHYGSCYFEVENFPKKIVEWVMETIPSHHPRHKALDLGCAVGRVSFELAHFFEEVYGVDFSARFIQAAAKLQNEGHINYEITREGDLKERRYFDLTTLALTSKQIQSINFLQGDACNLPARFNDFDLIVASNIIDRLYDPQEFLKKIHQHLAANGILIIASPYTWLSEYTEKSKWLAKKLGGSEEQTTLQALQKELATNFIQIRKAENIPFVIRETSRKFQYSLSEVTAWKRR